MEQLALKKAPDVKIISAHYLFASVCFLLFTFLLVTCAGKLHTHYFQPKLLALTHLLAIGWITMIIIGALYQLIPVILNVSLYSERIAKYSFTLISSGLIVMVYSFWNFKVGAWLQTGGLITATGLFLFIWNLFKSIRKTAKWTTETDFINTSLIYLLVTVSLGVILTFNLRYAFLPLSHLQYLKIHAHLGFGGWFLLLIIGVASRVVPMFLLVTKPNKTLLNWAYYLINAGLLSLTISFYFTTQALYIIGASLPLVAGLAVFLLFIFDIYKKRLARKPDIPMKYTLISFVTGVPVILFSFLVPFESNKNPEVFMQFNFAYGISFLLGFISLLIQAQIYKTFPFIIWLARHKTGQNDKKPKDLYSLLIAKLQFSIYISSFVLLITGLLLQSHPFILASAIGIAASAILMNINVFKIYLFSPK